MKVRVAECGDAIHVVHFMADVKMMERVNAIRGMLVKHVHNFYV